MCKDLQNIWGDRIIKATLLFFIIIFFSNNALAVKRFKAEQLQFTLLDSDGSTVSCMHAPLKNESPAPPPPWWTVKCNDRTYVVDVWMDLIDRGTTYSVEFLTHVKESTSSSGEKLTRFDSHLTKFIFAEKQIPMAISSFVDVRNGLADLRVTAKIQ